MVRPRSTLVAILAGAVLAGTGCVPAGGADQGPLAGETVEVAGIWSGAEQAAFRRVLDAFTARTGANVRYTSGGDDLPALLNSRLAGGAPPDVALLGQPGVVAEFARRGQLVPLSREAATPVREHYPPYWVELGTVDGALYGVYYKVAHKSLVWYRRDAFREAGVAPPDSWDEFEEVTRTLADAGVGTMALPGADGWVLTDWFENVYLRTAGPDRYDQLARRAIGWDHPSVVKALTLLAEFWGAERTVQGDPMQLGFTQAVADVFGARPSAAMVFEGDFVAVEIGRLGSLAVGSGADYFPFPAVDGSPSSVVVAGDQAVALTDRPVTMALLAFLASPEAAEIAVAQGGLLSANRDVDPSAYPDATGRTLAQAVTSADVVRFDLSDRTPQAFGGGTDARMWRLLQEFLAASADRPHVDHEDLAAAYARRLEEAAARGHAAVGTPGAQP